MTSVFVVIETSPEGGDIVKVFSSFEKAHEEAKARENPNSPVYQYFVEEWTVED